MQYTRLRTEHNKVVFFLPQLPELNYNNPELTVEKIETIPTIFLLVSSIILFTGEKVSLTLKI